MSDEKKLVAKWEVDITPDRQIRVDLTNTITGNSIASVLSIDNTRALIRILNKKIFQAQEPPKNYLRH